MGLLHVTIVFVAGLLPSEAFLPLPQNRRLSVPPTRSFLSMKDDEGSEESFRFFPVNNNKNDDPDNSHEVRLFESVLRDGEQGARQTLTPDQKGAFARRIESELGANTIIDAGLPGASPLDFHGVQSVVRNTQAATLAVLAHGTPSELRLAARALEGASERSRISTFHRPMELSTRYTRHTSVRDRLLKQAQRAVNVASDLAPEVQYYLVYAGNRDPGFLSELACAVTHAGASQVVLADSQSALTPTRAHTLAQSLREALCGDAELAVHCHNQLGLALPNTLAAIVGGASQVESCLLGVGDAGGNLATEQFLTYCQHARVLAGSPTSHKDDFFPSACSVPGQHDDALAAAVRLAADLSEALRFSVGENQPVIGERAFSCTTGIHQDNFRHLGHTGFAPELAGRSWKLELNRHSSQKAVRTLLSQHPEWTGLDETAKNATVGDSDEKSSEFLADALYAYLGYQTKTMDEKEIQSFCHQLQAAHRVLKKGGVAICPTTVGYTLITTKNPSGMKALKGCPSDKPCGILGTTAVYRAVFGDEERHAPLPSHRCHQHIVGYLGTPENGMEARCRLPKDAVGPNGEVGIWLECGPVVEYLANRFWAESETPILATSCNLASKGNPRSERYHLQTVDEGVRSAVDFAVELPHWESPVLDADGRWLSAPIWNLDEQNFVRNGRNQAIVSGLMDQRKRQKAKKLREEVIAYPTIAIPGIKIKNSTDLYNNTAAF